MLWNAPTVRYCVTHCCCAAKKLPAETGLRPEISAPVIPFLAILSTLGIAFGMIFFLTIPREAVTFTVRSGCLKFSVL